MSGTTGERPGRGKPDSTSLFGLVSERPHLAVVLFFLTLTVAVFAVRISRDTGNARFNLLAREGLRLYGASDSGKEGEATLAPADAEAKVMEWTRTKLLLPREEGEVSVSSVRRERVGRQTAAAVHFSGFGNSYLLLVVRHRHQAGGPDEGGLFSGSGFLSGEKEGKSFVYWEKEGASFFLVTASDLMDAIDLVRRYFT